MDSNCCSDEDGLPVLQLRKWGPSEFPYNASKFREGFISPTRKSLLLLSYDCEALLIPLDKGQPMNQEDPEFTSKETSGDPHGLSTPLISGSGENIFRVSEYLELDNNIDKMAPTSVPRCNDAFISDVYSVAWALCGDMCDQHEDSPFHELLFVSGKDGLVVHAFSPSNKSSETTKLARTNDLGKGMWVEWGPSAAVTHAFGVREELKSHLEACGENSNTSQAKSVVDGQSASRRIWMRTFLTKAEIVKSGNDVYTAFPKRLSFPEDTIVSFRIFDRDLQLSHHGMQVVGPSTSESDVDGSVYKCIKVFSNDSYQLVGFALVMINPLPVNVRNIDGGSCSEVLVSVARIVSWGMQWVYTVKNDENIIGGPFEWLDFAFSHRFLLCLSTSGLMALYGATNGEYIAFIDVVNDSGPGYCLISKELNTDTSLLNEKLPQQLSTIACKRKFTRLFAFPHSSLVGVMDECGVIHVVHTAKHVPMDHSLFENVPPYEHCPELGLLTRWEVGGADIGYQRVLNKSTSHDLGRLLVRGNESYQSSRLGRKENQRDENVDIKDWRNHDSLDITTPFHATQKIYQKKFMFSAFPSCLMRKVFLPPYRYCEDDIICCSPFGITRLINRYRCGKKWCQVVNSHLQLDCKVNDEINYRTQGLETSTNEAVGCNFHGFLYLVSEKGLSVVLPSVSVSPNFLPVEAIAYGIPNCTSILKTGDGHLLGFDQIKKPWSPWKVEVLDRTLLYEGPEVAEKLCLENGWDLRISRIRRLQLALFYLEFDEIENSLEMLMGVNLAVEGILRLLFAATYLMFNKVSSDNEVSAASRLLALATGYAIRVMREFGLLQHKKAAVHPWNVIGDEGFTCVLELTDKEHDEEELSRILQEIAQLLVVIRSLQGNAKFKRPGQQLMDNAGMQNLVSAELSEDEPKAPVVSDDALFDASDQRAIALPAPGTDLCNVENLALVPADTSSDTPGLQNFDRAVLVSEGNASRKRTFRVENSKDMMTRWELDNMDIKTVVKDALLSGRLPLAVLRLHLHHLNSLPPGTESHDTFNDVRITGRAIAYDLFVKGEVGLAITTLQKLGEDIETTLKQLAFGTVRRSLRVQIVEEMKKYAYLGPHELKILDMVALIERVYPCNSFFSTLVTRRKELNIVTNEDAAELISLDLLHPLFDNLAILCGEIDGVVLGSWKTIDEHSIAPEADDDSSHAAYWVAAAAWSDAWDQKVIDRILLDQPLLMGVNVLWESQFEYHVCHNEWLEVSKLLEVIPSYALSHGSLKISLDDIQPASSIEHEQELPRYKNYTSFLEELDGVFLNVPKIRFFRFSANIACSVWLRMLLEQQLAKEFIFLLDYWSGTADIVPLLAQSGFMFDKYDQSFLDGANDISTYSLLVIDDAPINPDTAQALHKVVIHFCAQYNLLNLLDIYLDHHNLAIDHNSLNFLLDATGGNEWAKCLLLLRIKGKEYDASFSNARAIASRNLIPGNKLNILESDDIIQAVDDIAEGAGEMAALATLMFAPIPLQECLSSGSVKRHCSSALCTLENLRPAMQRVPTLWNTLVAACFGQDPLGRKPSFKAKPSGYSDLLDYLDWREGVFFSSVRDTSILQMIPCWYPKAVRRLIQLYVQGPIGWQSLAESVTEELSMLRDIYYVVNSSGHAQISATSWEAAVQKHIEEELYASSLEGAEVGLEHHLHRGRALAALDHFLSARVVKLKSDNKHSGQSETQSSGQTNIQLDVQNLLGPITEGEESILSPVIPLAIEHFDDSVLVASCAFLLELCGLSAALLRIDIAALGRISSFYKSADNNFYSQLSPRSSSFYATPIEVDVTKSLARALADDYLHKGSSKMVQNGDGNNNTSNQPSRALLLVLQHLEKASLPLPSNGVSCGSWLANGNGNGADLRSQQKNHSQQWQLVTNFCRMHNIPLSTKYLAVLARDNDWVGYLSEAQIGKYPFQTVIQVASKEFSDPRLKIHILTVLKSMLSRKKISSLNIDTAERKVGTFLPDENLYIPVELFGIIAECEKDERPGEALLLKAKNFRWSILAMIASCFPDVSQLSCLTVWLEITAARETSAVKVNDIALQISKNVRAAVEAINSLPASARTITFHYNRKNAKRRHLVEPSPINSLVSQSSDGSAVSNVQDIISEEIKELDDEDTAFSTNSDSIANALSRMVAVLCEQHLFLPLIQAFEIFLPSCLLLPFIRALQAFSQMRLSEASAHLGSFASRIKEETPHTQPNWEREEKIESSWIISTAVKAADAMLLKCPSPYEKRCLLRLLAATDFGDGFSTATRYGQLCWKIHMAEPTLRNDEYRLLGNEILDDASLLDALEKNGYWEQARSWAKQLEASGEPCWKSAANHVTEMQAEALVAEWKEFLWDVPEERAALWSHCQTLFISYSFPALQAGQFFLKHAEAAEKDIPARELHEILLLALQWLSGIITLSNPLYPLHHLREIETRVWLLAVESEAQVRSEGEDSVTYPTQDSGAGKSSNLIDYTASIVTKMDNHINALRLKIDRENNQTHTRTTLTADSSFMSTKIKRRAKGFGSSRKPFADSGDKKYESESIQLILRDASQSLDENFKIDASLSRWEERVGPAELERAVLSLLDFGQTTAARQLQNKLSPNNMPAEFALVDAALKLASLSTPSNAVHVSMLDDEVCSVLKSYNLLIDGRVIDPCKVLESLSAILVEGSGRALCKRIISVVKAANVLGLTFSEAFEKQPIELLQLLSLKAQDSFEEARLLVRSHSIPAASIAQILSESFLKGLLAAHRGGYMDSQKEEGPAPLLWRFSDFLKWAELCPSDSEIGHALMRLVITGQEIPHACEVELLILSHHFYKLSSCLDGVDVLVALSATRVEAYVWEGDFSCLARLITGVGNFHALDFILGILIENGQLDLLLQKYSAAADANSGTAEAVRGFRMAVLTSLKQFNPNDVDAFAMVYNHFDMKHETAALLELRATQSSSRWFLRHDWDHNEDLLDSMRHFIEAAEVYSSIDAGNKTRRACARASLVSLQIRMPDTRWLDLSETNARRTLVEQSRFQEALIVAEAYGLNQPSEWALVLWDQMLNPELTERFVAEFVAVLPLQPSMLLELARFYRSEMQARGDQSQFSVWLTGGGLPADWAKYLARSFRCLLRRTRDIRLRLHLAATATGFDDVVDVCNRELDRVPESAGPLILRKGHGGAYLPLM